MRFPFDTIIARGDDEIEVRVIYDVTPFVPARLYGDYPQPEEGGEVEVISVTRNGEPIWMTPEEEAAIQTECEERSGDDLAAEADAAAEWCAQSRRDDRLMKGF